MAQLNGAYGAVYDDMVGYARLTRGSIIAAWWQLLRGTRYSPIKSYSTHTYIYIYVNVEYLFSIYIYVCVIIYYMYKR